MREHESWRTRKLDRDRWVYVWDDGIYSGLRAEDERLCVLVVVGVNERGQKAFLAIGQRRPTAGDERRTGDCIEFNLSCARLSV
jgi:hypothetical protein